MSARKLVCRYWIGEVLVLTSRAAWVNLAVARAIAWCAAGMQSRVEITDNDTELIRAEINCYGAKLYNCPSRIIKTIGPAKRTKR